MGAVSDENWEVMQRDLHFSYVQTTEEEKNIV